MLSRLEEGSVSFHETPIKRGKDRVVEPNTAESEQTPSKAAQSLEAIEAKELFERFEAVVRVSEEEEFEVELGEPDLQRRLDYDQIPTLRLDFEPKSSSMKKKPRRPTKDHVFRAINLFAVQRPKEQEQPPLAAHECRTPEAKERTAHPELSRAACKERGLGE